MYFFKHFTKNIHPTNVGPWVPMMWNIGLKKAKLLGHTHPYTRYLHQSGVSKIFLRISRWTPLRFIQFPDPSFNHRIWNLKSQRMSAKYGVWLVSWLALWKQLWEWPSRQRIHSGGWDRVHMWRYMHVIFSSKIGWLVSEMWFKPLSPYDTWHFKKQQTDASVSGFFRSDMARVLWVRPVSFEVPGSKRQSSSVPNESNSGHSAHRPWVRWYWALDRLCHEYLHGYAMVVNVSRHRSFMILIRGLGFPSYLPEAAPAPTA